MKKKNKTTKMLTHDIPLRLIKILSIICLTIPFACCWYGYYSGQNHFEPDMPVLKIEINTQDLKI